jgi:hypothetical protein
MSATTPTQFGPYATRDELAKGKRRTIVNLLVALFAVALSIVASRLVSDGRLVALYLAAGGLHFAACVAAAVRWSRTPDFGSD